MSTYAAGTKLSDLALTDGPDLKIDAPSAKAGLSSSGGNPIPVAHRVTPSSADKPELPRIAEVSSATIEISTVEAGTRARVAAAVRDRASEAAADYLAEATQEFESGTIDAALWAKAMELTGNDVDSAKPGYLRARAAALRGIKRNKRAPGHARRAEQSRPVAAPGAPSRSRRVILIAGALGCAVVVAGFLALRPANGPTPTSASDSATRAAKATQTGPTGAAKSTAAKGGPDRPGASNEDFVTKVQELKTAGNWNVLVLYAVEWTRKIPDSPDAWAELAMGYVKLHQFNEALDAATNAARLAPARLETWQTLGEINVALQQPAAALAAYEKAVALNARDVASLVQMGMLYAQLGQLSPAKDAFARALDISPSDPEARCGSAAIAQKESRPKEADVGSRQLKAFDLRCSDSVAAVPVPASAPPSPASKKPASRTAR